MKKHKVDWHVHTYYSDGTESPETILALALQRDIAEIGIVDHDTFLGHEHCAKIFKESPVRLHLGVEISAYDFKRQRKVHLLAYDIDDRTPIKALCDGLLAARTDNTLRQLKVIQSLGYAITLDDVKQKARHSSGLYKQHVMMALIDQGYTSELYGDLYQQLFKQGEGAKDILYSDVFTSLKAIKQSGGTAVLAHPGQLNSYELVPELVALGLDGIELYHPDHTVADHQRVRELADCYGLSLYGGSDFHGAHGPDWFGKVYLTNPIE
ncbi:hypothetical protein CBF34_08740 [Vagococcus penaei]|uniref:Uncharacterized protein n=1 Tax=Vagococcus penaei TaxID=633807 RepID=A0A1Q2D7D2_9ENTE|nr:PHP domain-containing protein [Vagococcus penaei]AQP54205.1 hypothetical protein BW732_08205 [Vagococcus penaei]RST99989.1 hypothetical protein CBF34_08740 [Vagococcus penaei]